MTGKAQKEIIITGILVVVLISVSISTFSEVKKKKSAAKSPNISSAKRTTYSKPVQKYSKKDFSEIEKTKENLAKLEQESSNLKLKRDVFVHGSAVSEEEIAPSDLTLYGIIWDKDNPIAIINETIVKTGDKVGISTIKKIEQDCVIVNDGSRDYKLNLNLN